MVANQMRLCASRAGRSFWAAGTANGPYAGISRSLGRKIEFQATARAGRFAYRSISPPPANDPEELEVLRAAPAALESRPCDVRCRRRLFPTWACLRAVMPSARSVADSAAALTCSGLRRARSCSSLVV